jgi:rhodanese-related sulfurtransferase
MLTVAAQPNTTTGADPQARIADENCVSEADIHTVRDWLEAGEALLVDVREAEEFEEERVPGAVMTPVSVFDPKRFPRLKDMKLVLMCASGRRSRAAAAQLLREGHVNLFNMTGGLYAWKDAGYITAL